MLYFQQKLAIIVMCFAAIPFILGLILMIYWRGDASMIITDLNGYKSMRMTPKFTLAFLIFLSYIPIFIGGFIWVTLYEPNPTSLTAIS